MSEAESCRLDVWLWRARFFKTRSLAAHFVETGRVRVTRAGAQARVDKPARPVRVGDALVFALGGRLVAVSVEALGERRGPASEAKALYAALQNPLAGALDSPALTSGPHPPNRRGFPPGAGYASFR